MNELTEFAFALAKIVEAFLPPGFAVTARGATVRLQAASGGLTIMDLRGFFDEDDEDRGSRIETAALSVLNTVQDFVSESLTVPWPQDVNSATLRMAMPGAVVAGERLTLFFGDPEEPSLLVGELNVANLRRADIS